MMMFYSLRGAYQVWVEHESICAGVGNLMEEMNGVSTLDQLSTSPKLYKCTSRKMPSVWVNAISAWPAATSGGYELHFDSMNLVPDHISTWNHMTTSILVYAHCQRNWRLHANLSFP